MEEAQSQGESKTKIASHGLVLGRQFGGEMQGRPHLAETVNTEQVGNTGTVEDEVSGTTPTVVPLPLRAEDAGDFVTSWKIEVRAADLGRQPGTSWRTPSRISAESPGQQSLCCGKSTLRHAGHATID